MPLSAGTCIKTGMGQDVGSLFGESSRQLEAMHNIFEVCIEICFHIVYPH